MRRLFSAVAFAACPALAGAQVGPDAWVQTWADEFDAAAGTRPDPASWNHDLGGGGWGNNELQVYTDSTANARHDGAGHLLLTARREAGGGYTSARLHTLGKIEQTYGRFEARLKTPTGQGVWPAFWMLGADFPQVGWPRTGEIDVMEHLGHEPRRVHGTIHGPGYSGGGGRSASFDLPAGSPAFPEAFHTFAVEWEPGEIRWYVDDAHYHTQRPGDVGGNSWVFDRPANNGMFMILNVAVGGNWTGYPDATTSFPQTMTVDHVRTFEKRAGTRPTLDDGRFDAGTGDAWRTFGNAYRLPHDTSTFPVQTARGNSGHALKLFGDFDGNAATHTVAEQVRLAVEPGRAYLAGASLRTNADDAIAGTGNRVVLQVAFLDDYDRQLALEESVLLDGGSPVDQWLDGLVLADAPAGAASATLRLMFVQPDHEGGAAWVDGVTFVPVPTAVPEPAAVAGLLGCGLFLKRRRSERKDRP